LKGENMKAIILAAGQGKRMKSRLHKLLHPILGREMIRYPLEACKAAGIEDITVVVSPNSEDVRTCLENYGCTFAVQEEALGTGHAVMAGIGDIKDDDTVLILCGDMPLLTNEFLAEASEFFTRSGADGIVVAMQKSGNHDFGRVYDNDGIFVEIVEARDLTAAHGKTKWANTGVCVYKGYALKQGLGKLTNNNSQKEYYLTDVPKILTGDKKNIRVLHSGLDSSVFTGVNTQAQLAEAVKHIQKRTNDFHMENGVRMPDPATVYIDGGVTIAEDVVILPGVILEGSCTLETGVVIGPYSHLKDTVVKENASVRQSVADSAVIGANTSVGPFAYLRPGTIIGDGCRIGNFVEVKNSTIGNNVSMAHLAYIGDADVGSDVNFSCGAITCNYDGEKKHRTIIKDGAFIGSNVNLVAPVTVGESAFTAAGSTITKDVPPCALGIERNKQVNREGWRQ